MSNPELKNFRRIVVKVGSSLLIDSSAGEVRASWLAALAADISKLHQAGKDVLVVSSGSIALGRSRLKLPSGLLKLEESQAKFWSRCRTPMNGGAISMRAPPSRNFSNGARCR